MQIAILSCGSIVVREKEQNWLFGAPEGIKEALDAAGIDVPPVVFTTSLRSPGYKDLGPIMRFKELPLNMNGLQAKPINHKHGTDYEITAGDNRILFSERGDVSVEDTANYHLAVIKNKHRADAFGENVITWPWKDAEFTIQDGVATLQEHFKVWSSMDDVPDNKKSLDGAPLSLDQANFLARVATASGKDGEENWAIAYAQFKKSYEKKDDKWVKKETETAEKDMMEHEKLSQELANYVADGGENIKACANCEYYCKNMTCKKVDGEIQPAGVCSLWEQGEEDEEKSAESTFAYMGEVGKEQSEKEFVGDRPIPRIIDILTAALHKAYNDTSDKLFQTGYLSQDERMKIAGSIGTGLTAFRNEIQSDEFADRAVDKWDADQLMQVNKDQSMFEVYQTKDDTWRWASITSVAAWDRQGEFLTTKAMDWAIGFAKLTGYKGPLRYKHIPGVDGGQCDTQLRIGDFLFESGTFSDNAVGLAMRRKLKEDPSIWQISPGLAFAKKDISADGVYKRAAIFERSMTQRPANPFTIILHKEETDMKIMTEAELKQAASELNMEYEEVKMMYERALAAGSGPLGLKEFTEVVEKATGTNASGFPGGANSTHKKDGEDETELLKEAVAELDEEELKHLAVLVGETLKEKGMVKGDKEEEVVEEEMTDEEKAAMLKGMKKVAKKEAAEETTSEVAELKELVAKQTELLMQQTKAMAGLAQALQGGNSRESVEEAVANIFSQVPRKQANGFVSQRTKSVGQLPDDNAVMQQLEAIQQQLKEQQNKGRGIYDAFTSARLNQPKGGIR